MKTQSDSPTASHIEALAFFGSALVIGLMLFATSQAATRAAAGLFGTRSAEPTCPKVVMAEMVAEWQADPVGSGRKYRADGFQFKAVVREINSQPGRPAYAIVEPIGAPADRSQHARVFATSDRAKADLAKCQVGEWVAIRARPSGEVLVTPYLVADSIVPIN